MKCWSKSTVSSTLNWKIPPKTAPASFFLLFFSLQPVFLKRFRRIFSAVHVNFSPFPADKIPHKSSVSPVTEAFPARKLSSISMLFRTEFGSFFVPKLILDPFYASTRANSLLKINELLMGVALMKSARRKCRPKDFPPLRTQNLNVHAQSERPQKWDLFNIY